MYCGVDLAVKRKSTIAFYDGKFNGYVVEVDNSGLSQAVRECDVIAVDSPLSLGKGYRDFERCMVKQGLRVFPTSFLRDLYNVAIHTLGERGNMIETHPGSSRKLGDITVLNAQSKDEVDAITASLTAFLHSIGCDYEIWGLEGVIHLAYKVKAVVFLHSGEFTLLRFSFSRACRSSCTSSR
mgnify:CR=1 FL=1